VIVDVLDGISSNTFCAYSRMVCSSGLPRFVGSAGGFTVIVLDGAQQPLEQVVDIAIIASGCIAHRHKIVSGLFEERLGDEIRQHAAVFGVHMRGRTC